MSVGRDDGDGNRGESGYVGYEMSVRDLETRFDSIIGASGWYTFVFSGSPGRYDLYINVPR